MCTGNFPPVLIGSDVYVVTAATVSVYNFTVTDDDAGVLVGIVGGTPARSSLTHTGSDYTFAWTPASLGDVNGVTFYATDSLGASGILRPTMYLCPCLNGGTCANDGPFNSTRNVTVMYCNCPPGEPRLLPATPYYTPTSIITPSTHPLYYLVTILPSITYSHTHTHMTHTQTHTHTHTHTHTPFSLGRRPL